MPLSTFFAYDDHRVGVWISAGAAYDVCSLCHPQVARPGPDHARTCLVSAVLAHEQIGDLIRSRRPDRITPGRIHPPVQRPTNVFGAPVNYLAHRGELGAARSPTAGTTRELGLFVKATGSVSGPSDPIELPGLPDREFHYEGEIAIVIGRPATDVRPDAALHHVAGFTGALDITMRLADNHREERSMRKSYSTFTPTGPAVLPLAEQSQATSLSLRLSVNSEPRQAGRLDQLIVPVAELVSLASSVVTLQPGDLILTGTPAGVGPLSPGDVVDLDVDGVGRMSLPVTRRPARPDGAGGRDQRGG